MSRVLIIIPAYNESENILTAIESLDKYCPEYDRIVINDCSTDDTFKVCNDNNIKVVDLPINLGIGGAVQTGYMYAFENGYDIAVQYDGDGQHPAEYIKEIVDRIDENCNMCIGSRFLEKKGFQSTAVRRVGIKYFSWLITKLGGQKITDATSGFRAVDRNIIEMFAEEYPIDYPEPETLLRVAKNNYKIAETPVVMKERANGKSSITTFKSFYYTIKVTLAIFIASIAKKEGKDK